MIAVIAGASGLVGSALMKKLLDDSNFSKVICLLRKPLGFKHEKLSEVLTSDFTNLKDLQNQLKGDAYFCCLGSTIKKAGSPENFKKVDFDAALEFGRIAKANDAQSFLMISASGANENSKIFYSRVKGEADKALMALNFRHLVIFRPSLLIGERKESRPLESLSIEIAKGLSPFLPQALRKRAMTSVEELADRMNEESKKIAVDAATIVEAHKI